MVRLRIVHGGGLQCRRLMVVGFVVVLLCGMGAGLSRSGTFQLTEDGLFVVEEIPN